MKYYFVLNPASGNKKNRNRILIDIRDVAKKYGLDYDVYFTKAPGDARYFAKQVCEDSLNEPIRIYGFGGDGTDNELVNGAYGHENVEIGIVPFGTGNDYIRNYGDPSCFLDIDNQILGESRYSDLIKLSEGHTPRGS